MLTDKYRFSKIAFILIITVSLCIYSYLDNTSGPDTNTCLRIPGECKGIILKLGGSTKIGAVRDSDYELIMPNGKITTLGSIDPMYSGTIVQVILKINQTGEFETEGIYARRYRTAKIVVSTIPVLILIMLFLKRYKFSFTQLLFLKR